MLSIKTTYELTQKVTWQGDPCAPQFYRWEGLNCSYPDSEPPQIITLYVWLVHLSSLVSGFPKVLTFGFSVRNLSESNLTGTITPDISKLTHLIEL